VVSARVLLEQVARQAHLETLQADRSARALTAGNLLQFKA
jgi:hypothetical protein